MDHVTITTQIGPCQTNHMFCPSTCNSMKYKYKASTTMISPIVALHHLLPGIPHNPKITDPHHLPQHNNPTITMEKN